MGLCPSRNSAIAKAVSQKEALISKPPGLEPPTVSTNFKLRPDADEFVMPQPSPTVAAEKEPWEKFLDQKQKDAASGVKNNNSFVRKVDGTFTADYRRLLETEKPTRRYVPPQQRSNTMGKTDDLIREWKETDFRPKKGYGNTVEKKAEVKKVKPAGPKQAQQTRFEEADLKLRAALAKVKSGLAAKDAMKDLEALEAMAAQTPKDDSEVPSQLVPFGLTDYHYFSDTADGSRSQAHVGKIVRKPKDYAKNKTITPELEDAMTEVLFRLRNLRNVETGSGLEKNRRYCVGIREVGRALKGAESCALKAVLVAPDVEQGGRTVRGSLDEKLGALLSSCAELKIPVVYGLSRVRLGQAIKKSVTISVMGIMDVRGMQQPFETMLTLAQ